jgi:hypothetical protein
VPIVEFTERDDPYTADYYKSYNPSDGGVQKTVYYINCIFAAIYRLIFVAFATFGGNLQTMLSLIMPDKLCVRSLIA